MQSVPDRAGLHAEAAAMTSIPTAIKHLRAQTGCSLKEGLRLAHRIADDHPHSNLALARAASDKTQRRLSWAFQALVFLALLASYIFKR